MVYEFFCLFLVLGPHKRHKCGGPYWSHRISANYGNTWGLTDIFGDMAKNTKEPVSISALYIDLQRLGDAQNYDKAVKIADQSMNKYYYGFVYRCLAMFFLSLLFFDYY